MKNFIVRFACVLAGIVLLAGCASSSDSDSAKGNTYGKVALLFSPPVKPYSDVGTVATPKSQPSGETWQRALQRQAATRGADAIIVDTATLNNNTSSMVSGKAIRYQ